MPLATSANRRALLGWSVVAIGLLGVLGLAASASAAESEVELGDVTRGSQVYALQCATCHGSDGNGGDVPEYGGQAPSLRAEDNPDVDLAYLDLVMATGRMPPEDSPWDNRDRRGPLSQEDRMAVLAWMRQEFDVPGELPEVGEGDPASGQQVWNTNCAHCHGSTGAGGVAGAGAWTPPVLGYEPTTIAEAIRVGPFEMPRFTRAQISDREVNDVAVFLDGVAEEEGTPVLGLIELNPVYASAFVALLAVLMLLLLVWIGGRPTWFPDQPRPEEPALPSGAAPRNPSSEDVTA